MRSFGAARLFPAAMRLPRLFLLAALVLPLAACDSDDDVAGPNSTVIVAYEGRLQDGTVFDESDRARFPLRGAIPGFRDNAVGMRVGETKTFTVPPEEGYGAAGAVDPETGEVIVPPNATLTFEVELLDVL